MIKVTEFEKRCYVKGNEVRDKNTDDIIAVFDICACDDGPGSYELVFSIWDTDNNFPSYKHIVQYNPNGHSYYKED